jgi:hypothetical protein
MQTKHLTIPEYDIDLPDPIEDIDNMPKIVKNETSLQRNIFRLLSDHHTNTADCLLLKSAPLTELQNIVILQVDI